MHSSEKLPVLSDAELDIRVAFDQAWHAWTKGKDGPVLRKYLSKARPEKRADLFPHLLQVEREARLRRGETLPAEDYQSESPEYGAWIKRILESPASTAAGNGSRPVGAPGHEPRGSPGLNEPLDLP